MMTFGFPLPFVGEGGARASGRVRGPSRRRHPPSQARMTLKLRPGPSPRSALWREADVEQELGGFWHGVVDCDLQNAVGAAP